MSEPVELFTLAPTLPDLDRPVLVQALDGFVDAGGAVRLARNTLLGDQGGELVAAFDVDLLYDYRARRPIMLFDTDHWADYRSPQLALHALRDAAGTPYLLLAGPEPDLQWERFAGAVELLVQRLGVRLLIGMTAIPMAVPHTRPAGVISHASRSGLVRGHGTWVGQVQVPASAGHLLEYRLGRAGLDVAGFAVHVPHYLAHLDYPAAGVTLLEEVARVGGLVLPTETLEEAARTSRALIDEQVAQSEEVAAVVRALETQYDAFVAGARRSLLAEGARLPTADELAAEFERFLAEQSEPPEHPGRSGEPGSAG